MTPTFQQQPLLTLGLNPSNRASNSPSDDTGPIAGVATGVQSRQTDQKTDTRPNTHTPKSGAQKRPERVANIQRRLDRIAGLATDCTLVRVHAARTDAPEWPAWLIQSTAIWAMLQSSRRLPCVIVRMDVLKMAVLIAAKNNWSLRFGIRDHNINAREVLDHLANNDLTWIKYGKDIPND
jgi:hypothetical protein